MELTARPTRYADALREGRPALGSACQMDGFATSHLMAASGLDFLMIDYQHGLYDWMTLETVCYRVRSTGAAVIVRPASDTIEEMGRSLELPLDGVLVPDVNSFEQAQNIMERAFFPPRGTRPMGGARNALIAYPDDVLPPDPLIGLLIEHIDAVEQIDQIVALPNVGFIMVGQFDLGKSMGISMADVASNPPDNLLEAIQTVRTAARGAGTTLWSFATSIDAVRADIANGVNAVMWNSDVALLRNSVREYLEAMRS
jgi:2-keto-3-deoxy-L-rhamnonate aldolase RhmA